MTPTKREAARTGAAGIGVYVAVVLGVLVLAVTVVFVFGGFSRLTADFRGETGVRERTLADPNYRIAQYEKFYDNCASVQALEDQLAAMKADTSLPKDQRATNVLALTNQRNTLIRQYNADSRKAGTQAQFKASDLPYTIDPTQENTSC